MEERIKKQHIIIKICCVIAAFILWLYIFNAENPIIERNLVVPVQIVNKDVLAQSKLVAVGDNQSYVELTIRGNASDIYSAKPDDFKLQSDVSAYVMRIGENRIPVEVKKSPQNIRIANSENLWVKISLDNLKQKTIPVKVVLTGKTREGFFALQPTMKDQQVQISGAAGLIDSVNNVVVKCDINGASKDLDLFLPPEADNSAGSAVKDIEINPKSVQVTVPIKKIKTVPINVKTQGNLGNGGKINSITPVPSTIDIAGEDNIISGINSLDTESVDLTKLGNNSSIDAKVVVPKGVILVNSNGVVKLNLDFNKGIQKELSLDIQTRNLGNNYSMNLDNNKTTVTVSGLENIVNNIKSDDIQCFVDLNSLTEGDHVVNINVSPPEGVTIVSQNPTSVTATINRKILEGKNDN